MNYVILDSHNYQYDNYIYMMNIHSDIKHRDLSLKY